MNTPGYSDTIQVELRALYGRTGQLYSTRQEGGKYQLAIACTEQECHEPVWVQKSGWMAEPEMIEHIRSIEKGAA